MTNKDIDIFIKKSMEELEKDGVLPTDEQKELILKNILMENKNSEQNTWRKRVMNFVTIRPYRFAFSISAVQALLFTLIFGNDYTNLLLNIFR